VIGQNISLVLVVGTRNYVVFQNRDAEEITVAEEPFDLLPGSGDFKARGYGTAEFPPRGLFSFQDNSPSFRSTAFKNNDVCDGTMYASCDGKRVFCF